MRNFGMCAVKEDLLCGKCAEKVNWNSFNVPNTHYAESKRIGQK
jgi:hypothetical protein